MGKDLEKDDARKSEAWWQMSTASSPAPKDWPLRGIEREVTEMGRRGDILLGESELKASVHRGRIYEINYL